MSGKNVTSKSPHMTFLQFIPCLTTVSFITVNFFYRLAALFNLKSHPMGYKHELAQGLVLLLSSDSVTVLWVTHFKGKVLQ